MCLNFWQEQRVMPSDFASKNQAFLLSGVIGSYLKILRSLLYKIPQIYPVVSHPANM